MKTTIKYPDPVLRKEASVIELPCPDLVEKVEYMAQVMGLMQGVGLAAPQIGWSARLFITAPGALSENNVEVCINPEIISASEDKKSAEEGCLSIPKLRAKVPRLTEIHVGYQDIEGDYKELNLKGLPARVFQHEIDHLDGVLIIDRMSEAQKVLFRQRKRA